MLSRDVINLVLAKALSTGGDFAEIFVENTIRNTIDLTNGSVDSALSARSYGAGIRVFKGFKSVFASSNDLSLPSLLMTAQNLADAISDLKADVSIDVTQRIAKNNHPVLYVPSTVALGKKIEVARRAAAAAKDYSNEIVQTTVKCIDWDSDVMIANSEGLWTGDRRIYTRMSVMAVASNESENQIGSEAPGRRMGFEMFETLDMEEYARRAAKQAVTMLHAKECPAGRMPVAIENGFGGVIFHEACGHSLEATSVAKGNSEFCGKLGQQIANPKVTAIDDGTIPNAWGSIDIDDEGTPGQRNVLIENGILKGYMIDKLNARRMGMAVTGSSRRQSYEYAPTSRMTNTFIANGTDDNAEIIRTMGDGLYAKKMGGGSVNPMTGDFNFSVSEGYLVRNGEICEPVRGASLIGKGSEILMKIDMVGQNLDCGQGMCGSSSGSVPTNVGQPLIRVSDITVGGRG